MKNKPIRHKEKNTFQFKSFSERINDIDIDVFHRVAHKNEENNEEVETYFHETLQKWNFLNLTEGYCTFKRQVRDIVTLPQLLNKKQHVMDLLLEYIKKQDVLFLQPILELVVALAKDLQKDFYDYFPEFLNAIIDLLQTKDPEQIEYAFVALAYLFKFLWRYLVKNVRTVLDMLLPLLNDAQPVYINNFAAESFAFVVRKVKDKEAFVKLLLKILEESRHSVAGSGRLMFEVISGTPGQFHSCADQILLLYFHSLKDQSINQDLAYSVMRQVVNCILRNIHPSKCYVLWNTFLKALDATTTELKVLSERRKCHLELVLCLMNIVLTHKNGRMLDDPVPLINKLINMIEDRFQTNDNNVSSEIINALINILLSDVKLAQETSSHLLHKIMSIDNVELLYNAIEKLINYSSFETLVLPHLLKRCNIIGLKSEEVRLLGKIIRQKAPPCLGGLTLNKWKKFTLDIRNVSKESMDYFLKELNAITTDITSSDALWMIMIVPHFKLLPEDIKVTIKKQFLTVYKKILYHENMENIMELNKFNFIFLFLLDTTTHILEREEFYEFTKSHDIEIMRLLEKQNNDPFILNAIDLYLTFYNGSQYHEKFFNQVVFDVLHNCIVKKLNSPIHPIRLIVTHIYSLFANVAGIIISKEDIDKNPLNLIYLAEGIPATIQRYRDKLLHLQDLTFESNAMANLNPKYYEIPLRYLLGNFYINFSLLWDPVSKIIGSYASKECGQFWPVFLSELKDATDWTYQRVHQSEIIQSLELEICKMDDKADNNNYKILLWKCMPLFASYCEMKNRDLTSLFIEFVNNNFFKSNAEDAKFCSIKKHASASVVNDNTNEEGSNTDEEAIEKDKMFSKVENKNLPAQERIYKIKLLLAQMDIYGKMRNPNVFYRETEMHKIYLDLLSSKNPEIQNAALNCLCTYKYKYLLPYKDHLYNIIGEKNFKNELARFKVDPESNVILDEDRAGLMPVLMRIVYAKMIMKTGMRTGGKAGGLLRRKIILRFLAGSKEDEMIMFVEMAFKPFKRYLSFFPNASVDLNVLTKNIIDAVDLTNVIPPKRLRSAINLLGIMIEQFGGKMTGKLLPYLLGISMCIGAIVTGILQRSDEIHSGYLSTIKNVKTNSIAIIARFFSHFENYPWKKDEIDALFNVMVFPWLEKLPIEGIHSPTALLKLFISWSQNSRYYPLFLRHQDNNINVTILPYIMKLLLGTKTHSSVINAILEMIEKMLTMKDYEKVNTDTEKVDMDMPFLPLTSVLTNLLPVNDKLPSDGSINYGSIILLPHVDDILEYMKRKLKNSKRGMNKTELTILSRISEFAKDPDTCDTLLVLILPILMKKALTNESEDIIIELITTVRNLIKHVKSIGETHLRALAPLLGVISSVPARKLIIQLYGIIAAERSAEGDQRSIVQNYNLLEGLNAWDRRWIDQPDFEKRLNTFGDINDLIEKNEIALNCGASIIYNCFFFLKNESDLAIKDYAGQCLKNIGPKLARKYKDNPSDRRYLMDETILHLIKKGISSKSEVLCSQSIAFLGHMSLECPDVHPVLRDLSGLCNKADPEVDFFENMQHLQMHRRARALLKFCALSKTLIKRPNPKTLTQFILPLASTYLCNEAYINKNNMVDAAIETIGTICKLLPWYHYEIILKYYLNALRRNVQFQKQIIRLIVTILDSFHYELSKYKPSEEVSSLKGTPLSASEKELNNEEVEEDDDGKGNEDENEEDKEERMDVELNNENIVDVEDNDDRIEADLPLFQRQIILSQYGAKRVISGISKGLLPQLYRSIAARTRQDGIHKINKKKVIADKEEEDLMRVPIALALVKLLQKLPEDILESHLPGIFMKLCTFLKSRLESVRRVTREVLQKIMITLGPKYLHHLLRELNSLLTKGFQVHVLAYTIHSVLNVLKPHFQKFDINSNLQSILSVCKIDLFGLTAEEKEVIGIVKNVTEAKSTKSYDIFHILAEYMTESCLLDLMMPLKDVLMRTHSHKTVQKVVECLKNIVLGLADNNFIPLEQTLIFLYGIVSESIPELLAVKKHERLTEKEVLQSQKPDCFIIPAEPKNRMGMKVASKTTTNTNVHVIVEFGLKLYHIFLKREKISDATFKPYLEPLVSILTNCLKSQHVKLCTLTLQCLSWILKMDLTSVRESITDICSSIFEVLHKYAAAGLSKGDNFDLVMAAFKCVSVLVRDVKHFTISVEQLKILLLYAEQDLYDGDKQATAFALLKAIIKRKLTAPEMDVVMKKVAALSITSELEHVRLQSRSVFYSYLMEYPHNNHLDDHIAFYLFQLSYEMQYGRISALQMINSIITGFPLKSLIKRAGFIFLNTSARLVNDDDPICRKLCATCIKVMLIRLPHNERDKLFDIVFAWLKDSQIIHRRLAAQLCGIFVVVEKETFESRLANILPILLQQFHDNIDALKKPEPGHYVKLHSEREEIKKRKQNSNIKDPERLKDHHLYQVLQLLLKISGQCPGFLKNKKYNEEISSFAEHSQSLLAHPHLWVRLGATQLIGFILSVLDVKKIVELIKNPEEHATIESYIYSNPVDTLKSLSLDLIAQLQPDMMFEELADQVVKNLIFLGRILKSFESPNIVNSDNEDENKDGNVLSLSWLMRRLRKSVNIEVIQAPKSISVRSAVFKWIAGILATIPIEELDTLLFNLMSPLVREMSTTEESNAPLRQLAKEVASMIKKQIGIEEYARLLSKVQQKLDSKKTERRKIRKQQLVTDPELAAKRKIAKQQKKKESKKRKLDNVRGKNISRKRFKKEIDLEIF
ncbi:small subunit processome component 20 homolog isoform X1 [Vespa mandarinia]|uniref:small subunit processome component 20 homolog isoform X1 n=1 Tax=Vespa mandarinia TaxID=7446 RepID=UPI0016157487|nr:small subunit processome component 20 homolog isoform X1 [Vespa mandarinia]